MNYKFETVEDGKLPTRKTRLSAGFDCESRVQVVVYPYYPELIPLGFKISGFGYTLAGEFIDMSNGLKYSDTLPYLSLVPRSSLRMKSLSFGGEGVIDIDYRGEVCAVVQNLGKYPITIVKGQAIAQLMSKTVQNESMGELETMDKPRQGGFGSTNG